jgi:hypothetical protein
MGVPVEKLIDPGELRIGNILSYKGKLVHVTNLSLDIDDEYTDMIGFCQLGKTTDEIFDWNRALAGDLDRVRLTPEILKSCGFEKDGFGCYNLSINPFDSGTKKLFFVGDYLYLQEGSEGEHEMKHHLVILWNKDLMKEFYLHQLQNLYFSLTGKELTFSLANPTTPAQSHKSL